MVNIFFFNFYVICPDLNSLNGFPNDF